MQTVIIHTYANLLWKMHVSIYALDPASRIIQAMAEFTAAIT